MKKILSTLLFATIVLTNNINAQQSQEYPLWKEASCDPFCSSSPYFTLGTGPIILIPSVGLGYRARSYFHGVDTSINISTIGYAHQVQGSIHYLYHPNPFREDPWFIGIGPSASACTTNHEFGRCLFILAPDFVIGKEITSSKGDKHFVTWHLQTPNHFFSKRGIDDGLTVDFPLMYIRYGVKY